MNNLKDFVSFLEKRGLVAHVRAEVDPDQEIAEIHRRVIAANGPALLFHRVKGSKFPVVTNLFGTSQRIDLAFGQEPVRFMERLVELAQTLFPPNAAKIWEGAKLAPRLMRMGTKRSHSARVQNAQLLPPDLEALPMTKSWSEDGGSFLTLPLVLTEHPEGRGHNLGIYRMQRFDHTRLGMHWQIAKGGGFHYQLAEKKNQSLPVTIHLGGPPAVLLAAVAPLPENVGELMLASFLLGKRLKTVRFKNHALPVVADCEFALLGHVPPFERNPEGPFGDHYGYYSLRHDYPVFHCREIWHAKDAVFPATVVGKPRQEDYYIGEYLQKLLKPLFPLVMPGIVDLWSYGETGFHSLAAAVVQERYEREAMVTAFRILGEGQLALTKFLLILDEAQELADFSKVLEHVLERADFKRDLYLFNHLSMDTLDYTGPEVNKGSKGILLGIGKPRRKLPGEFSGGLPAGLKRAKPFCKGALVVEGEGFETAKNLGQDVAGQDCFQDWPLIILVDDLSRALANQASFLWTTFTRFEPAADMYAKREQNIKHHIQYEAPIVIDARLKPSYPKELFCAPDIQDKVTRRWSEYFPQGMEAGSSDFGNLG